MKRYSATATSKRELCFPLALVVGLCLQLAMGSGAANAASAIGSSLEQGTFEYEGLKVSYAISGAEITSSSDGDDFLSDSYRRTMEGALDLKGTLRVNGTVTWDSKYDNRYRWARADLSISYGRDLMDMGMVTDSWRVNQGAGGLSESFDLSVDIPPEEWDITSGQFLLSVNGAYFTDPENERGQKVDGLSILLDLQPGDPEQKDDLSLTCHGGDGSHALTITCRVQQPESDSKLGKAVTDDNPLDGLEIEIESTAFDQYLDNVYKVNSKGINRLDNLSRKVELTTNSIGQAKADLFLDFGKMADKLEAFDWPQWNYPVKLEFTASLNKKALETKFDITLDHIGQVDFLRIISRPGCDPTSLATCTLANSINPNKYQRTRAFPDYQASSGDTMDRFTYERPSQILGSANVSEGLKIQGGDRLLVNALKIGTDCGSCIPAYRADGSPEPGWALLGVSFLDGVSGMVAVNTEVPSHELVFGQLPSYDFASTSKQFSYMSPNTAWEKIKWEVGQRAVKYTIRHVALAPLTPGYVASDLLWFAVKVLDGRTRLYFVNFNSTFDLVFDAAEPKLIMLDGEADFFDPETAETLGTVVTGETGQIDYDLTVSYSTTAEIAEAEESQGTLRLSASEASSDWNQVYTLFIGYFGRPPAPAGVNYYEGVLEQQDGNWLVIADDFWNSPESQALYPPSLTTREKINIVFNNLFSHDATSAGLDYWEGLIDSGEISLPELAYTVAYNASDEDDAIVAAKRSTAALWAERLDTDEKIAAFNTNEGLTAARSFLASVDTGMPASQAEVDQAIANLMMLAGSVSP